MATVPVAAVYANQELGTDVAYRRVFPVPLIAYDVKLTEDGEAPGSVAVILN